MAADWLITRILAAPVKYGQLIASYRDIHNLETIVNFIDNKVDLFRRRRRGVVSILPSNDLGNQNTRNHHVDFDAQSACRELQAFVQEHRHYLLEEKTREKFDKAWGMDRNGCFKQTNLTNRESSANDLTWTSTLHFRVPISEKEGKSVSDQITEDIKKANSVALQEFMSVNTYGLSDTEKSKRILLHFQKDLLVGLDEEIVEAQDRREYFMLPPRHMWVHRATWALQVGLDFTMLFYLFLFGVSKDAANQRVWVQSFAMWLLMEILFFSSIEAVFPNVLMPMLLLRNAAELKFKMMSSLMHCKREMKRYHPHQEENTYLLNRRGFNAASYLFVSHHLAKRYAHLHTAQMVLAFHTVWPRESYGKRDGSLEEQKVSEVTETLIDVAMFLTSTFLKLSNQEQDVTVRLVVTWVFAYVVNLHVTLYAISPVAAILPGVVFAIVSHFLFLMISAHKREREKLLQVGAQDGSDVNNAPLGAEDDLFVLSDDDEDDDDGMVEHVGRRQSIVAGLLALEKARKDIEGDHSSSSSSSSSSSPSALSSPSLDLSDEC